MLWLDKYQPRHLVNLSCHDDLNKLLLRVAERGDVPHLLFYGPPGAGKKTRMMAILRHLFGDGIDKVKAETISPEGTNQEFISVSSSYHNQVSASELGNKDRVCVQHMIKNLSSMSSAFSFAKKDVPKYRVFIIQEAEELSSGAQAGLRRTLEKYVKNSRIFLHCQQLSAIMPPLRSRCLCIRVPLPTVEELVNVLQDIATKEQLKVPKDYLNEISHKSNRDMRRAILMLEAAATRGFSSPAQSIAILPWEAECDRIAGMIKQHQTLKCLSEIRESLYDLLCSCIPGSMILEFLCKSLLKQMPTSIKPIIIAAAAHYSHTMSMGTKEIWHIEAFVAQVMNICKKQQSMKG